MKLVIVTGLSGSGKSIALHTLEDMGYYCIDNLPMFLLRALIDELSERGEETYRLTAVGIDARNRSGDLHLLPELVKGLEKSDIECQTIFLEAQDEALIRRFSETRRKHPLVTDECPLAEAIELERHLMEPILTAADLRIDTTRTTQHQLRDMLRGQLGEHDTLEISLLFQSFGYKHGVPRDADFVYDMRCLPNPYWDPALRSYTGRDEPVQRFLEQDTKVVTLKQQIIAFLDQWIPSFEADGRNYLTIAVGCTGGQHRSVYMAEQLADHFRNAGRHALTRHRELS
jgi:UPF0042 nucleotide-binding protein